MVGSLHHRLIRSKIPIPHPKISPYFLTRGLDGADITKNEFEIDVLTRPFMGPKSTFDQWIKGYPKYAADYQYRTMARTVYQTKGLAGGMIQCNIQFKGLIDGVVPLPVIWLLKTSLFMSIPR